MSSDPEPSNTISSNPRPGIARQVGGYFGAFFILGMLISSLGPSLPYLAQIVGVEISNAGAMFSIRSLGYMLGALFLGRLYDHLPGNRLLTALLGLVALMTALVPLSPSLALMALPLFFSGLSLGGMDVGCNTLTIWLFGKRAGPYLNALFVFAGVGGLLIPLVVGWTVESGWGVRWAYWLLAALILPVAVWIFLQPSPVAHHDPLEAQPGGVNLPLVALFGSLFFLYVSIETGFGGWIYTYTISNGQVSVATASLVNSLFWTALTLGRLVAIPVSRRLRPMWILRLNLLGALLSLGLILLIPHSMPVIAAGTAGLGFSLASTIPAALSMAERRVQISGRLTGQLWALGSLGAIVTPWLLGQLMSRYSPEALLVTLMVCALAALMTVALIGAWFKQRPV